jgi:hypothetical protein
MNNYISTKEYDKILIELLIAQKKTVSDMRKEEINYKEKLKKERVKLLNSLNLKPGVRK